MYIIKFFLFYNLFEIDIHSGENEQDGEIMARPINFQQILAFKTVMELGTTIAAAEYLNTTQPSISRRISEIQAATELELFELYRGRLRPTNEAKLLYKTIQKHFDGLESIENVIAIMRHSGVGVLRIGSTPTIA